jgi:colanic acid/amylovoran biosynthesis protein
VNKRVAVMGTAVSSGNRGVAALGASLINLCSEAFGEEPFLMLGHDNHRPAPFRIAGKTRLVSVVPCRLSPRSRIRDHMVWILLAAMLYRTLPAASWRRALSRATPWIAALERADLVGDVRGGDSFSDIYGMQRFLIGFFMAWTVLLVKGRMVQFPQTFGPFSNPIARLLARYLLKRSSVVIARDERSRKVAQSLMGRNRNAWLSPDVAFSLETVQPEKIKLYPPFAGTPVRHVIGLNVNGLMSNGGYTRRNMFGLKLDYRNMLPELVNALLKVHPGEIWLVPHTYGPPESVESDPEACRRLRDALSEESQRRVRIVAGEYDQHEIKGVIGCCDFFIGSRMHACIAALSQGIPCVGIAYSVKFQGVFESVGMNGWVVDGRNTANAEVVERVIELYSRRHEIRADLARNAQEARSRLKKVFRLLVETAA